MRHIPTTLRLWDHRMHIGANWYRPIDVVSAAEVRTVAFPKKMKIQCGSFFVAAEKLSEFNQTLYAYIDMDGQHNFVIKLKRSIERESEEVSESKIKTFYQPLAAQY